MAFPPHFLDELRGRVGLASLIGRRVKLIRKGREYSGLCPFHNKKTPSFTVNGENGFFHGAGFGHEPGSRRHAATSASRHRIPLAGDLQMPF